MDSSALQRAQSLAQSSTLKWQIVLMSIASALLVLLLVIDLGLIVQLLVTRRTNELPDDLVLGSLVGGIFGQWPPMGDEQSSVAVLVVMGAILAVGEVGALIWLDRCSRRLSLCVAGRLRTLLHEQTYRLGASELLGVSRSRPEVLFFEKVESVRTGLLTWHRTWLRSVLVVGLLLGVSLAENLWLTLLAILLTYSGLRIYRGLKAGVQEQGTRWAELSEKLKTRLMQSLRLAPLTAGYSMGGTSTAAFKDLLAEYHSAELHAESVAWRLRPWGLLIVLLASGFLLLIVGLSEHTTLAGVFVSAGCLLAAYFPAVKLYKLRPRKVDAEAAAGEIFAYLDRGPGIAQIEHPEPLERLQKQIRLDHVTLADRSGRRLLDGVSLTIPATGRSAVLASDPQMPLALAGLFVRFYDPASGRILYDDHDIRRATLDTVRGQAVLVAADSLLFPGTIAANITCGDSGFTTLQINDAAKRARAAEVVQALPEGLSTAIDGHNSGITTDQAFRIAIARALLRGPSLLIVEEPAGDFDEATARKLDEALQEAARSAALIIIPARLSTLRSVDRIYLFHEGKLHTEGTHTELLQSSELYRHMIYVRFNTFRGKVSW